MFNNKVEFVKILNALGFMKEQYKISLILQHLVILFNVNLYINIINLNISYIWIYSYINDCNDKY